MTIFARQKAVYQRGNNESDSYDRYTSLAIEQSWKRVLAIARNQLDDIHTTLPYQNDHSMSQQEYSPIYGNSSNHNTTHAQHRILSQQLGNPNNTEQQYELYDRERLMVQALDTLFSATCEGAGYIIFLTNMVQLLDPECPVSMAFLSHVIDRATLPSKDTMRCISPAILAKLNIKCSNQSDSKSIIYYQDGNEGRGKWSTRMAQYVVPSAMIRKHQHYLNGPMVVDAKMKRNALVIWAILAEKFAGNMVHLFWTPDVARTLFHYLGDTNEDWTVRVSALLTLEKFALTGEIKTHILHHPLDIQSTLQKAIHDSHHYEQDIKKDNDILLLTPTSSSSSLTTIKTQDRMSTTEPHSMCISGLFNTFRKHHERPCMHWMSACVRKISKRTAQNNIVSQQENSHSIYSSIGIQQQDEIDECGHHHDDEQNDSISCFALTEQDEEEIKSRRISSVSSKVGDNYDHIYDKPWARSRTFTPDKLMKRMELAHCAEWSLRNIFNSFSNKNEAIWDLTGLNVIMNPLDATQHWKLGSNGLELRNDRLHFESIRATVGVKKGRWYYEVLLVTEGIMQIGWCTKRCRFVAEEGYGVGDDQHGFAFDTYRSAVWANGSAVYPQQCSSQFRCRSGDVLGSYLDLEQGICSFFVNGKDLGMTVAFEHGNGNNMEDLFPGFSLTTHQHIIVNFGDQPWTCVPQVLLSHSQGWKGINQAGTLTDAYCQQVQKWLTNINHTYQKPTNDDSMEEVDWDGPLCTMCFTEPKDTALIPCGHGGWGAHCAKLLESCPLCRMKIEGFSNIVK